MWAAAGRLPRLAAHLGVEDTSECVLWPEGTKGSKQGLGGQGRAGFISSLCDMKAHRLQATSHSQRVSSFVSRNNPVCYPTTLVSIRSWDGVPGQVHPQACLGLHNFPLVLGKLLVGKGTDRRVSDLP